MIKVTKMIIKYANDSETLTIEDTMEVLLKEDQHVKKSKFSSTLGRNLLSLDMLQIIEGDQQRYEVEDFITERLTRLGLVGLTNMDVDVYTG